MCTFGVLGLSCEAPAAPKAARVEVWAQNGLTKKRGQEAVWAKSGQEKLKTNQEKKKKPLPFTQNKK